MIKLRRQPIYITSDLHLNHTNYCMGTSRWGDKSKCRQFNTVEEMNQVMLDSILKLPEDSILFLLGDTIFGHDKNYYELFNRIPSSQIYHIHGNHENINKFNEKVHSKVVWSGNLLKVSINSQHVIMTHRPLLSWEDMDRVWCLHGHTHGELTYPEHFEDRLHKGWKPKILDVGIDNYYKMFNQYKVFSWNEITTIL